MKNIVKILILGMLFAPLLIVFPVSGQELAELADTPWPMYQHDPQHTGRSPLMGIMHQPVLLWSESLGDYWDMGGMIIAADGNLLIADGRKLIRFDPIQRQSIWQLKYYDEEYGLNLHSRAIPLLASDGNIYLGRDIEFIQVTPDAQVGWSVLLDNNIVFGSSAAFGPDGNIYVVKDGLWSITQQGDVRWVEIFDWFSHASPAIDLDGMIYANGGSIYHICAWRPTGVEYWCLDTPHYSEEASPSIAANGNIIMASDAGSLYSFRPTGQVDWEFETEWVGTNARSIEAAIGPDETVYFTVNPEEDVNGYLYAVDAGGNYKWRVVILYNTDSNRGAAFYRPPITDRLGNVYICASNSRCYGISADGSMLWQFEFPFDDSIVNAAGMAPLIAEDGLMYIVDGSNTLGAYADPEVYPLLFSDVQVVEGRVELGAAQFSYSLPIESTILPLSYSATDPAVPWLTLDPSSGVTPGNVVLQFDPSIISVPGIYRTEIQVRPQDRVGRTVVVPVELNVGANKTLLPMINKDTGHYQLIYLSNWYGKGQLVTNEIDGENRQVIIDDMPTDIFGAFFSPNARRLAHFSLVESVPDLTNLSFIDTVTGQTLFQIPDLDPGSVPSWSPDGDRFVMAFFRDDPLYTDLYIVELNGTLTRLTDNPYDDLNPVWSPTGEWIAFTNNDVISLIRPNGTDEHPLQIDYIREYPVGWSIDGRLLFFYVPPRYPAPSQLWAYDVQTNGSQLLVESLVGLSDASIAVSPDGSRIAFFVPVGDYPNREIRVITLNGGEVITISPEPGEYRRLDWSPDSHWLSYDRWRWRTDYLVYDYDIYVVRRDGTSPHILTTNIDWDRYAAWRR
jgi:Tol biopolymer transport system component